MRNTFVMWTDFSYADMASVHLGNANGQWTNFTGATAECAVFTSGDWAGASWDRAKLSRVIGHPDGVQPISLQANFARNVGLWSSYDYRIVPPMRDGYAPLFFEPSGGRDGNGLGWTSDRVWGVDFPDDDSILILIHNNFGTLDLTGATVEARFRTKDLDLNGGELHFFINGGTRHHTPVSVTVSDDEWTTVTFTLTASLPWTETYVRDGTAALTPAQNLAQTAEIGFSWRGFTVPPTGQIAMDYFRLDLTHTSTAVWAAANPHNGACIVPDRRIPYSNAV